MTKKEKFCANIEHQLNIKLENDNSNLLNKKPNMLYTCVSNSTYCPVFSYLAKNNIPVYDHMKGYFWIDLKAVKL